MTTEFEVISKLNFTDGTVVIAGTTVGPLLSVGQRGRAATPAGEVEVEILSVGINNLSIYEPSMQSLQIRILQGDERSLKGARLKFG